ncbi:MAG: hypothetical protein M1818_003592 [Claussenomyces sp. TS43310]|nr:MAG: hypothetical protein M1818_003592 [Claussenomyces sp. TS43310]
MEHFKSNDGITLAYQDVGSKHLPPLILLHGFTGSSAVFKKNIPHLADGTYRIIAPDLRGHGQSSKPTSGYHVARLAMDLEGLIEHLKLPRGRISCLGASLGAAIIWSHAELFTTASFSHVIFIDQAPLQNYTSDGSWGPSQGNWSCNSAAAVAALQSTLRTVPDEAYKGTIATCLGYRWHPLPEDGVSQPLIADDESFFLDVARQGRGEWFGKLMADHTALDWRDSIVHSFGPGSGSTTRVLVIASDRSGCFPAAGPLTIVDLVNGPRADGSQQNLAQGKVVSWGGHWCYWEHPERFDAMVLEFLGAS